MHNKLRDLGKSHCTTVLIGKLKAGDCGARISVGFPVATGVGRMRDSGIHDVFQFFCILLREMSAGTGFIKILEKLFWPTSILFFILFGVMLVGLYLNNKH